MTVGLGINPGAVARARVLLRPVEGAREFHSAAEMRAHYSAIARRLYDVRKKWDTPVIKEIVVPGGRNRLVSILYQIAKDANVSVDDLRGPRRIKKLAKTRAKFYYKAMSETACSCMQIAKIINKDHTTVIIMAKRHAIDNGLPPVVRRRSNKDSVPGGDAHYS